MTAQLQTVGRPLGERTPLEAVLGTARGRYFGAGYRSVSYSLTSTVRDGEMLAAVGHVAYPSAWSTDAVGAAREPHLSSIDAVLLPLALLEARASPQEYVDLGCMRITRLHLTAGATPFLALKAVPIRLTIQRTAEGQQVHALVGNIKVGLSLAAGDPPVDLRTGSSPDERTSVYSSLFRQVESTSWIHHGGSGPDCLIGDHVLSAPPSQRPRGGYEACHWPAPTLIDHLVVMGQLTQALVYTAAGRQRATSGPLWMRTIDISMLGAPAALPARFQSRMQLLRDRSLKRGQTTLHDCKVEASTSIGVSASATLAYQEL